MEITITVADNEVLPALKQWNIKHKLQIKREILVLTDCKTSTVQQKL